MTHEGPNKKHIVPDGIRSAILINRCNLPPWLIGSEEFQENPTPIEVDGVQITERWLFQRLAQIADPNERGGVFHDYLCVKFGLQEADEPIPEVKNKTSRSYVHFLQSWGADSNGYAGAVLKAWVESRFGLLATYHKGCLSDDPAARDAYLLARTRGAAKTIAIFMQLDLLYAYCQFELRHRFPGERWKTLYRGTHDPEEYTAHHQEKNRDNPPDRITLIQLNNLSSFTSDREVAWEFGSTAWEVKIPIPKIVFFSGLLPNSLLHGESEYLVLGGFYKVRNLLY